MMKTCPNCQRRALSLITDLAAGKRYCYRCIPNPMNCLGAVFVARKMEEVHLAGKLETYSVEQRLKDLKDPPRGFAGGGDKLSELCRRRDGSFRAHFHTRAKAEAFAADPQNHPVYLGDIAHHCAKCGFWHLSRFEWLFSEWNQSNALIS